MLAFGIRYLNGFVVARTSPDDIEAEWPPHPARVFMALAAAHFLTGADSKEREALLWLQSLEKDGEPAAPWIAAPEAVHRHVVTQFTPVNPRLADERKAREKERTDGKKPPPALQSASGIIRTRQPRTFTRAWLADDTVYMRWPDAEPDEAVRAALAGLCSKVTRIGHSSSLVQMWIAMPGEGGEPNWVPDEDRAGVRLRVAPAGTLEYLEHRYNGETIERFAALGVAAEDASDKKAQREAKKRLRDEFVDEPARLRPSLSIDRGYARPLPPKATAPVARSVFSPYLVVLTLERKEGSYRQLELACVPALTQRWRDALLSQNNGLSAVVRSMLSGHDADGAPLRDAHLAFVPLAFVGREHADGRLLGMAIALPEAISRDDRREVLRVAGLVRELKLGRLGVWRMRRVVAERPPRNLLAETWTAYPAGVTEWATVTPIAFDSHPKSKGKAAYMAEVETMITECCIRVGLPAPSRVVVTPVSAHTGAPTTRAFPALRRKDGSLRRQAHAILVFDEPICGPVLLGAGRYRGYGLCRPLRASREEA